LLKRKEALFNQYERHRIEMSSTVAGCWLSKLWYRVVLCRLALAAPAVLWM
jgi:hypothetical protein